MPQPEPNACFREPVAPAVRALFDVARADQAEDAQLVGLAAEDRVVRHAQDALINFPFGRRLIDGTQGLPQVFFLRAGREQFNHDERRRLLIPADVAHTRIPLAVKARHTDGGEPVRAFVPTGVALVVIEVHVYRREVALTRHGGRREGLIQQGGLNAVEFVGHACIFDLFAGEVVHRRERRARRLRQFGLGQS
jgi:hypothetical protein